MDTRIALDGGIPIRKNILQYGKQTIDQTDINSVIEVLKENKFLTTGPKVNEFEKKVCKFVGAKYGVAVNSGTAALHTAVFACNLKKDDEVIVTCLSFVATSNAILYCDAKPIFCDIEEDTMNIDPVQVEKLITNKTRAIISVDFTGQPCNYEKLIELKKKYNLILIEDAAHSIGAKINYRGVNKYVGSFADLTTFSFHPVKNITTCEGGMIMTNNEEMYKKMISFRNHGISKDYQERETDLSHYYEMNFLGFNYRIPDLLCALGINQLNRLPEWIKRRQEIATKYDNAFSNLSDLIKPLTQHYDNAYHIYIIKLNLLNLKVDRDQIFKALKAEGIGVNVHYMPIHLHPFYKNNVGTYEGMMPVAEKVYKQIITLPIFPSMNDEDVNDVINSIIKIIKYYKK